MQGMRNREHAALPPSFCWIFFWPLVVLGLLAEDVFYALFGVPRGPSMLSALKASTVLSPVAGPWSTVHPAPCIGDAAAITPAGTQPIDADASYALDLALMKPSCCDAPAGLCHFWDLPRRLGEILTAHAPRPALACHPGCSALA